jgi:hypothetical protein
MFKILLCISAACGAMTPAHGAVYRCTGAPDAQAQAQIRYQQVPCPNGFTQASLVMQKAPTPVAGEPNQQVATPAPTHRNHARSGVRARSSATRVTNAARQKRVRFEHQARVEHAGCPPTYEAAGSYVIGDTWVKTPSGARVKVRSGLQAAWTDYKNLPTRTYLKNAGKWPSHCPQ